MNRSHRDGHRLRLITRLLIGAALLLAAIASAPRISPAEGKLSAEQAVQRAWQRAAEAGSYDFATEIVQTVYPAPALVNVGRSSRKDTLHIEGQTNLSERTLLMSVWTEGGTLLDPRDGVEIRIEDDRAYGRQIGEPWQEISDFSGAFAPDNDLMAYLAGAKNVRELGTETRSLPSLDVASGSQSTDPSVYQFTRYSFDLDGPTFARHLRDQLEKHLT
ncbi:MAG: hypothetical protein PVI07_14810, partial [Anaerolineae bacterium]